MENSFLMRQFKLTFIKIASCIHVIKTRLDASIPKNHLFQFYNQQQRKESAGKKGNPQQQNGKADDKLNGNDDNTRSSEVLIFFFFILKVHFR